MDFKFEQTISHLDRAGLFEVESSPNGPVVRDMLRRANKVAALAKADCPKNTGRLARSISVRFVPGKNPSIWIGSDVSYAKEVHDGTRPHHIHPKTAKVLRFMHRGRVIYAREVFHPGTRANPFLARHLRKVM